MIRFLDNALFSISWPWPIVIIVLSMAFIAVAAYLAKALSVSGSLSAFVMGIIVLWTTRFEGFLLFMLFFVSCTVVGKTQHCEPPDAHSACLYQTTPRLPSRG